MAQLDFTTRQLANPSAGVQQSLHDLGAMFGQFQQNKIAAEDKAEQRTQRALENKRADAMLSIQQRQADQQAEKFGIDKATIAGTQAANRDLQNATQGLITPEQADVIRQAYEKNKGTDVVGMTNKAQAAYEASPTMQRQYLSGVNIAQEPTQMQVGVDELGQPKMMTVQGDPAKAQDLKTQMLRDYDTKIQQDKLFDESQRQFGLKQKLDEAQLKLAKDKFSFDKSKPEKDPIALAYQLGLVKQKLDLENPVEISKRKKETAKEALGRKDEESKMYALYRAQVPMTVDAYDFQQWKKAGMPLTSERGLSPFGTWGSR